MDGDGAWGGSAPGPRRFDRETRLHLSTRSGVWPPLSGLPGRSRVFSRAPGASVAQTEARTGERDDHVVPTVAAPIVAQRGELQASKSSTNFGLLAQLSYECVRFVNSEACHRSMRTARTLESGRYIVACDV